MNIGEPLDFDPTMYTAPILANQGGQYAILDVSTLPAGIYMICHTQAAGTTYISSFVKQ